jgi:hypothetical protein
VGLNRERRFTGFFPVPRFFLKRLKQTKNMGFFSNLIGATVKTALTPVAIVKDAVNVVTGQDADETKKLLESAGNDIKEATDDLADGEVL